MISLHPTCELPTYTILVVDDDPVLRKILIRCMKNDRHNIVEARDGQEAIEVYQHVKPNLVLLDASMPVMDGFECCAYLRQLAPLSSLPILMITGLDDEQSVNAAFDAGATDFITKPIHQAVLRRRVKLLLDSAQLQRNLELANEQLQTLATTDSLTGLFNRRAFDEMLAQEWERSFQKSQPLTLILCDVDYFKRFNDTYGHPAGDRCLQQVGQAIRQSIRWPVDIAARYGGEEFAVVLPNSDLSVGIDVAQRIQSHLQEFKIRHEASLVPNQQNVTLSGAVASVYPHLNTITPQQLISLVDNGLYQAKARGRNQILALGDTEQTLESTSISAILARRATPPLV